MKLLLSTALAFAMLVGLPACQKKSSSRKADGSAQTPKQQTQTSTANQTPAATSVQPAAFSAEATCEADIKFGGGPTTLEINSSQGLINIYPTNNRNDATQYRIAVSGDKKWWAPKSTKYTVQPSTTINNTQTPTTDSSDGYLILESPERDKFGDKYRNVFACGFAYKGKNFVCTYPVLTKFNCR